MENVKVFVSAGKFGDILSVARRDGSALQHFISTSPGFLIDVEKVSSKYIPFLILLIGNFT